jgi:hypothetical protein
MRALLTGLRRPTILGATEEDGDTQHESLDQQQLSRERDEDSYIQRTICARSTWYLSKYRT